MTSDFISSCLLVSLAGALLLMHTLIKKFRKPTIFGSGKLKEFILSRSEFVHQKYCPPILCLNPAVQFVVRAKYEKPPKVLFEKKTLKLKDGGMAAFDQIKLNSESNNNSNYVLINVPGLRETTHTTKVMTLAKGCIERGFSNFHVMNYRGSCSIPIRSKMMSSAFGEHNHVAECVEDIESRFPEKKIVLVGACLGAMCIVDYLSKPHSDRSSIVGAVIHSCNWQLDAETLGVTSGVNYNLFNKALIKDTLARMNKNKDEEERALKEEWFKEKGVDMEYVGKAKSIWDLEERFVAKIGDLSGADEYYEKVSPVNKFRSIKKPVIIINSRDDFMAPFSKYNLDDFQTNPNLVLWSTAAGGHVSFVHRWIKPGYQLFR